MANVLLRSPYYISEDIGSDLSAKIEITIDGTLAYTIVKNKPANNNGLTFCFSSNDSRVVRMICLSLVRLSKPLRSTTSNTLECCNALIK